MSLIRTKLFLATIVTSSIFAPALSSAELSGRLSQAISGGGDSAPQERFTLRPNSPPGQGQVKPLAGALAAPPNPLSAARLPLGKANPAPEAQPSKVDESALRFYASQNDSARVSMEIKRIKVLHPGWEPPTDLFDEARDPAADKKLWELYAANRFDDILTFVQDIRAADPTWRPSPEFVKKFETASTRADIIAASDAKDATAVLRLAEENPDMLVCGDVDVLWRVAEALVATNEADKAKDLYGFILNQCTNTAERVATLQKAMQLLPLTTVQGLMAATGRRGLGDKEMESVRLDLLRRQIGTAISDPTSVPPEAKTFEALVIQRKLSTDAVLLGWYRYAQKDWKAAEVWFKQAMDWERMPKAAEGYALTLRQQGLLAEAEAVAFAWRDADPLIAKLYVEIVATELTRPNPRSVEERRLAQMEEVVAKSSSALGAQAMGWYFYNTKSFPRSSQWFAKSVEWEPTETSALGLALAAAHAKDQALFRKTVAQYGAAYPTVAALESQRQRSVASASRPRAAGRGSSGGGGGGGGGGGETGALARQAVDQFKSGNYREALATLDKRGGKGREDQGLGVLRGWALYHLSQYDKARAQFAEMDKKGSTRDTQYGLYYSGAQLDPTHLGD